MSDFEFDYEQEIARLKAENNRMRADLTSLRRQADISERAANGFYAHAAAMELQRDQARADLARAREAFEGSQDDLAQADGKVYSLSVDLARALPVVEAAGAVVEHTGKRGYVGWIDEQDALLFELARAYRAAREPRTGEGT